MAGTYELIGFVDMRDDPELAVALGLSYLGSDRALTAYAEAFGVVAMGAIHDLSRRRQIAESVAPLLAGWARVCHTRSYLSPTAEIGEGSVVMAGAVVQTGAKIGRHCVINSGALVEHDVVVGDFSQIGPGAVVGGGVRIGADTYVGLGATIRDHLQIGERVVVGMGSVVVNDVGDATTVRGVPAR
jgi:acetyltransferase EpsM